MQGLRLILLVVVASTALMSCKHTESLVTRQTDRTGWVEVGKVPAVNVRKMQRVMDEAGIPAWFDAAGYPYYPVTVPPEHRWRATQMLSDAGFFTSRATLSRGSEQATSADDQKSRSFSVGTSREQIRAALTNSYLLVAAARPAKGWSSKTAPPAGGRAEDFERSHPGAVEACDVYWIGHTNAPRMYFGIPLNYFYFDRDQKLIGFERWFID